MDRLGTEAEAWALFGRAEQAMVSARIDLGRAAAALERLSVPIAPGKVRRAIERVNEAIEVARIERSRR